jgi:NB-ARC domain
MPCLQELLSLLQPDQPGGVHVLSLHGMGGIGKTTLARELFNRLSNSSLRFSNRIYLEVGQEARLLTKQRQLLDKLADSQMIQAGSEAEQRGQLENCTQQGGPLLLVLDDIWNTGQRDGLLCLSVLPAGSRVILTGRVSGNLHAEGGCCALRLVDLLAPKDAKVLLCQHAFEANQAPPGYDMAVKQALTVCGGLPLALRVVGAGLRKRSPAAAEVITVFFIGSCMSTSCLALNLP